MGTFDNVFAYSLAGGAAVDPGTSTGGALTTNLTSYWKMDEAPSNDRLDSHGTFDLTENGTCQNPAGIINSGASNNGSGNYLSRSSSAEFNGDQSFSFSLWFEDPTSHYAAIFSKYTLSNSGSYVLRVANQALEFSFYEGNSANKVVVTDPSTLTTGNWYHAVVTHDLATKTVSLYVNDGAPTVGTYTFTPVATSMDVQLGKANQETGTNKPIDEVAFWSDRVLTATDVSTLYNAGAGLPYEDF